MYELFSHFTRNEWIYESKAIYLFEAQMNKEEQEIFYIDPKLINWKEATCLYGYGVEHYMNKQDMYFNDGKTLLLLNKNKFRYFDNVRRVFLENQIISEDPIQIRKETFSSSFV